MAKTLEPRISHCGISTPLKKRVRQFKLRITNNPDLHFYLEHLENEIALSGTHGEDTSMKLVINLRLSPHQRVGAKFRANPSAATPTSEEHQRARTETRDHPPNTSQDIQNNQPISPLQPPKAESPSHPYTVTSSTNHNQIIHADHLVDSANLGAEASVYGLQEVSQQVAQWERLTSRLQLVMRIGSQVAEVCSPPRSHTAVP